MTKLVAVIDDDPEMGELYALMLESHLDKGEIELEIFSDSRAFLNWSKENNADLIVSDINMPHLTGLEMLTSLKKIGKKIPAILISGYESSSFKVAMKDLGVKYFISKPLDFQELIGTVEAELGILSPLT